MGLLYPESSLRSLNLSDVTRLGVRRLRTNGHFDPFPRGSES